MRRMSDFRSTVKSKVAERAAYLCSNPKCLRVTVGPDNSNSIKSTKTGVAAHICAASPGGPRYDMSQTPSERQNIANAIWLCASCSVLIDKNNGHDYPADHLRRWKKDHEGLIKECLEGNKRVTFQFMTLSDQSLQCKQIVKFLDDKGVLFVNINSETPLYVFESVKEIRSFLVAMQSQISDDSPLDIIVHSIINACRHFMNTTTSSMMMEEMGYSLGAMRKVVGLNLADMKRIYKIKLTGNLEGILPTE